VAAASVDGGGDADIRDMKTPAITAPPLPMSDEWLNTLVPSRRLLMAKLRDECPHFEQLYDEVRSQWHACHTTARTFLFTGKLKGTTVGHERFYVASALPYCVISDIRRELWTRSAFMHDEKSLRAFAKRCATQHGLTFVPQSLAKLRKTEVHKRYPIGSGFLVLDVLRKFVQHVQRLLTTENQDVPFVMIALVAEAMPLPLPDQSRPPQAAAAAAASSPPAAPLQDATGSVQQPATEAALAVPSPPPRALPPGPRRPLHVPARSGAPTTATPEPVEVSCATTCHGATITLSPNGDRYEGTPPHLLFELDCMRPRRDLCGHCKKTAVGKGRCMRCSMVVYCDRECQSAHWPQHKLKCAKWAKTSKKALTMVWRLLAIECYEFVIENSHQAALIRNSHELSELAVAYDIMLQEMDEAGGPKSSS
jgi:hypothetical protein